MEYESESGNPDAIVEANRETRWVRFVGYIKRKANERRTKKQNETPTDKAARRTAVATIWMAIFTFVLASTSGLTILILKNQLKEMHEGGLDTHTLAQAADTQAKKMADMSIAADKIRQAAEGMVTQEQRMADNSQKALEASSRQSKASLDATIATARVEQRAWVSAVAQTYPVQGIPQVNARFDIRVNFTNTGKTPAKNIETCTMTFAGNIDESPPDFACHAKTPPPASGIIPPGGSTYTDSSLTGALAAEVRDKILSDQIQIWVYGYVAYDDVFRQRHRTNFCYRVLSGGGYGDCKNHNEMD